MKKLKQKIKRWKRTLRLIFDPTTRQIAAAIRLGEMKQRNRTKRERSLVWIDPTVRARGYEQSAWNSEPDKNTDPFAAAHEQLQQRRAIMRHATGSIARKIQLVHDEEATQYLIPIWLNDQARP